MLMVGCGVWSSKYIIKQVRIYIFVMCDRDNVSMLMCYGEE